MADPNLETIEVIYQTQTDKAICVREDEDSRIDIWLPKSLGVTILTPNPERGDAIEIEAPDWLLEREGLI